MGTFKCLTIHYLTANNVAVFEMLCPVSKQAFSQGSVLRSVGGR